MRAFTTESGSFFHGIERNEPIVEGGPLHYQLSASVWNPQPIAPCLIGSLANMKGSLRNSAMQGELQMDCGSWCTQIEV
jgi:hypothetical protein